MSSISGNSASDPPKSELLDEYLIDAELQGLSEKTLKTYRSNLQTFSEWLDGDLREVDRNELKGFLYYLRNERQGLHGSIGLSNSAVNTYFAALNSLFQFLTYEHYVENNPVPAFRQRYVESSRTGQGSKRQLISVEEMATLVHATLDVRDRAIIVLFAKTGIRRNELIQIDLEDLDWELQSVQLKDTPKRTNTLVFFDGECSRILQRWLRARNDQETNSNALFTNQYGDRLKRNGVFQAVARNAEAVGLHDPNATEIEKRFTPHCCRHWFTTHLRRSGMKREFIQELRGDTRSDTIDIYDHIDRKELREAYLAHIPTLGI